MPIEGKRIAKNTGLLYFRMLLLMTVSLYTSRVLLSVLGVVDYGLYNVVGGIVVMIGFLQGTMGTASSRFVTVAMSSDNKEYMRKVFTNLLLINALLALIVVVLAETIGLWFLIEKMTIPEDRMNASLWVYQFSILAMALNIVSVPYYASIVAHERMAAFAYISLFDAFAKLLIVYLIAISPFDRLIFYAFLILVVQTVDITIYNVYCIRKFSETRVSFEYDKSLVKEIFTFISWASYGSFVSVGFTQGLNIILNLFFGPAVNAARGVSVQVQNAVVNFTTNFQMAINPQLMKSTAQANYKDAQQLLIVSSKFSFFLLCALGLPIIIEAPFVLSLWLKEVPEYSVSFCRIVLVISVWSSLANPLRIVNQAEGNIKKFQQCECTLLLLIMPLSYMALKQWSIPILVYVVHLVIELAAQFVRIVLVIPKIKMPFRSYMLQVYLRLVPVFIMPLLLSSLLHYYMGEHEILRFITVTVSCEIILFLVVMIFGLNKKELYFIREKTKKLIRR